MPSLGSLIAKVSLDYAEFELGADRSSQAALKMGNDIERAVTRAMGSYKKSVGDMSAANDDLGVSMARASAGAAALAESEDQAAARIKDMIARSLEAQQALQQVASASQGAADGIGAVGASADQVRANVAAQTQAMIDAQRATVLMNDEMQALRTTMAQGNASFATLGDQYSRLDRAMATGKLSMQEYDAALAALGKDEDKRVQALNALTSKYDPLGAATRKLAADQALLDDAYKSGQVTTEQYQQALAGIKADQAVVELRRLADQEAQLERAFKSGSVSSADYKKALADIGTNRTALSEIAGAAETAGAGMSHFGLGTAGARTEILRLANDLANGNFGRFDQSAMVLAERMDLLGAVTSGTGLAIAAIAVPVVAVGAAMMVVAHQNDAMNDALVLTGNYAGTTVDGLRSMADAATAGGASFNTAADAVTQLAAAGRLTGEEISGLGRTTADVATYTSMSVKQMVDEFTKLAEDPVKASVKLNDTYHYLTASTYDQIVALEKQGDATGAAQLAVETFSKTMDDRTKDIAANEGTILKGWRDIKSMINGAIEAVGMFGATATPGQVVAQLQARKTAWTPNGTWTADDEAELQKAIAAYQAAKKKAEDDARAERQQQEQIDAKHSYDVWNSQFATPAEKRAKEVQTYIDTIATPLNLSPDQQLADEQKINDKYKDKKTGSTRSAGLVDKTQLQGEVQAIKDALAEELSAVSSAQRQLDALYKGGGISESAYYQQTRDNIAQTATDKINAANQDAAILAMGLNDQKLSAQQKAQINNQAQHDQATAAKATEDFFNAIADSAAKEDEAWQKYGQSQLDATNKTADANEKEAQKLRDQADTYGLTKSALDQLLVTRAQSTLALDEEGLAMARLNNLAPDVVASYENMVDADRKLLKSQQDLLGAQMGVDAAQQAKKQQDDLVKTWQQTIDGIGTDFHDGFLQMLTNGQAGWDSFTKALKNTFETTVVNELYKEFAKPFIVSVIANIAGLTGGNGIANQILQNNGMGGDNALGSLSNMSSAYSTLTKGYSYLSGLFGAGSAAGTFGTSTIGAFGGLSTTGGAAAAAAADGALAGGGATLGGVGGSMTAGVGAAAAANGGAAASTAGASSAAASGVMAGGSAIPIVGAILAGMALNDKLFMQGYDIKNGLDYGGLVSADLGSNVLSGGLIAPGTLTFGATGAKWLDQGLSKLGVSDRIASLLSGTSIIAKLFGGGETRYGADYTIDGSDNISKVRGPSGGDPAATSVQAAITSTYDSIKSIASQLGGSIDGLGPYSATYEVSPKKGNSFVAAGFGDLAGDPGRQDLGGVKDSQTVLNDFSLQLQRSIISSLQSANLDAPYAAVLSGVDASKLQASDVTALVNQLDALKAQFDSFKTLGDVFANFRDASVNAQSNIVNLSGGFDNLNQELGYFNQHFTTTAEQTAAQAKSVTDQLAALGESSVTTNDQFRAVVQGIDLSTDSGQKLYAQMMALAPAFDQMTTAAAAAQQAAAQAAADQQQLWAGYYSAIYTPEQQLVMNTRSLQAQFDALGVAMPKTSADFARLVEGMDTSTPAAKQLQNSLLGLAPAFGQVTSAADQAAQAAQQAAQQRQATLDQAVQTALGNVQSAYGSVSQAIQSNITSLNQFIDSLTSLKQSLMLGSLSTLSPQDKYLAEKQLFDDTSAKAAAGDATAQGQLPQVAQDFLTASQAYNASSQAYVDDYNKVQASLSANISAAQGQLSVAQQQLNSVNQMVQGILNLNQTAQTIASLMDALKASIDSLHASQGAQALGPLGDVTNAYQQYLGRAPDAGGAAYYQNQISTGAQTAGQVVSEIQNSTEAQLVADYQKSLGRAPDAAGLAYYQNQLATGAQTAAQIAAEIASSAEAKAINGSHAGGLDSVPFDGYRAELHKGEAVVTSANNQKLSQMLSIDWSRFGGNDQTALLNEIKALRLEVSNLKGTVQTVGVAQMQQAEQQHVENKADMSKQTRHLQNTSDNIGKIANKR